MFPDCFAATEMQSYVLGSMKIVFDTISPTPSLSL